MRFALVFRLLFSLQISGARMQAGPAAALRSASYPTQCE
jgi:hypothetical protein